MAGVLEADELGVDSGVESVSETKPVRLSRKARKEVERVKKEKAETRGPMTGLAEASTRSGSSVTCCSSAAAETPVSDTNDNRDVDTLAAVMSSRGDCDVDIAAAATDDWVAVVGKAMAGCVNCACRPLADVWWSDAADAADANKDGSEGGRLVMLGCSAQAQRRGRRL